MNTKTMLTAFFGLLFLSITCSTAFAEPATKNPNIEPKKRSKLESTVMNQNLPLQKRIRALKELYSDRTINGHIERTFCIWDPLGKSGPIATGSDDQTLRAMHYGMVNTIIIFQDEKELVRNFLTEKTCDAVLVRAASSMQFNKFSATIEAVGALPERKHLQLLAQVLANPSMGKRLTNDDFTVMGIVTIGDSYVFVEDNSIRSLSQLKGKKIAVQSTDRGMIEVIKASGATPIEGDMMAIVQTFADEKTQAMLSPAIGYLVMGSGQLGKNIGVLKTPVAQSTMILIGRAKEFPPELAQILREDFLFKFDNYARRVDKEMANVPESLWLTSPEEETQKLNDIYQKIRIKLRDQGYYDTSMLRLARKIRCRFDPINDECTNPVE